MKEFTIYVDEAKYFGFDLCKFILTLNFKYQVETVEKHLHTFGVVGDSQHKMMTERLQAYRDCNLIEHFRFLFVTDWMGYQHIHSLELDVLTQAGEIAVPIVVGKILENRGEYEIENAHEQKQFLCESIRHFADKYLERKSSYGNDIDVNAILANKTDAIIFLNFLKKLEITDVSIMSLKRFIKESHQYVNLVEASEVLENAKK